MNSQAPTSTTEITSPFIPIMNRLKKDTTFAHKQLEKVPCFKRLFANDYNITEYARLISYFYGYFLAIEPILYTDLPSEHSGILYYRKKTHLLAQDLVHLNIDGKILPVCTNLPALNSFAEKMGALYVLEGSLLGGRVIGEHLTNHFGSEIISALSFYHCYGTNLIVEWRNFSTFMAQCFDGQDEQIRNTIVDSANATFSTLQQWVEHRSAD